MLKILPDHSWNLHVGQKQVLVHQLQMFEGLPCQLHTVVDVIRIVTLLSDGSKICVGNPDDKFKDLVSHYKGNFMDYHGNLL